MPYHFTDYRMTRLNDWDDCTTFSSSKIICPYCNSEINIERYRFLEATCDQDGWRDTIGLCFTCGWWKRHLSEESLMRPYQYEPDLMHGAEWEGVLKKLDLADLSLSVKDLKRYLLAKYDDFHNMNRYRFEDLVLSIFKNEGWQGRCTSRSHDGGIDIIVFDGPDDQTVGIQVKCTRNTISVAQIREFLGALLIGKHTKGIFISTSNFTKPASRTATLASSIGIPIELWDADSLLDKLRIEFFHDLKSEKDRYAPWTIIENKLPFSVQSSLREHLLRN